MGPWETWPRPQLTFILQAPAAMSPRNHPANCWPVPPAPPLVMLEVNCWEWWPLKPWRHEEKRKLIFYSSSISGPGTGSVAGCVWSSSSLLLISSTDSQHHGNKSTSFSTVSAALICCNELSLFFMSPVPNSSFCTLWWRRSVQRWELLWSVGRLQQTFTVWKCTLISFLPISSLLNIKLIQTRAETIHWKIRLIPLLKSFDKSVREIC